MMNKRARVLASIRVEVAREGKITAHAIRLYVENRVSYGAFMDAARNGLKAHTKLVSSEPAK